MLAMLSYNKKVRLKPYEAIQMADFNVEPDAPPVRTLVKRPHRLQTKSRSRVDMTHDFVTRRQSLVASALEIRSAGSAMELDRARSSMSRMSAFSADMQDEIAESSRELVESLPKMSAIRQEQVEDKKKKDSTSLDTPAKGSGDCLVILPQNTVPMAKYRKKIYDNLPDSDDEDAPLTDAQQWSKQKLQEQKGVSRSKFHGGPDQPQGRKKRRPSLWATPDNKEADEGQKELESEIYTPTYMGGSSMSDETLFSALTKAQPRRKSLAFIGNVVSKITKRRDSTVDNEYDEADAVKVPPRNPSVVTFGEPQTREFHEDDEVITTSPPIAAEETTPKGSEDNTTSPLPTPGLEFSSNPTEGLPTLLTDVSVPLRNPPTSFGQGVIAPPPMAFTDTNEMISFSELLVAKASSDHRDPENIDEFVLPPVDEFAMPSFPLDAIPEYVSDEKSIATPHSDIPVFIRPPETPFERSDDGSSEDEASAGRGNIRIRRRASKSANKRHRASRGNSMKSDGDYYEDTEYEKKSRRRRSTKRQFSAKSEGEKDPRTLRTKSTRRRTRRRESEVRQKVGVEHLDRAKREKENPSSSMFNKFATFMETEVKRALTSEAESRNPSPTEREPRAFESFAKKLVAMVKNDETATQVPKENSSISPSSSSQQTSRIALDYRRESKAAVDSEIERVSNSRQGVRYVSSAKYYIGERPESNGTKSSGNHSPTDLKHVPQAKIEIVQFQDEVIPKDSVDLNQTSSVVEQQLKMRSNPNFTHSHSTSIASTFSMAETIVPNDNRPRSRRTTPLEGDTGKENRTIVRLRELEELPGESNESLVQRVGDYLDGNSHEGQSHFQRVPGRQWVVEWARREEISNVIESSKVKRRKSSSSQTRGLKRSDSNSSIGSFFGRFFGRLKIDTDLPVRKETEVVASVYTLDNKGHGDFSTSLNKKLLATYSSASTIPTQKHSGRNSTQSNRTYEELPVRNPSAMGPIKHEHVEERRKGGIGCFGRKRSTKSPRPSHSKQHARNSKILEKNPTKDSGISEDKSYDSVAENGVVVRSGRPPWAN